MSVLQFAASLVSSLAWPLAVLAVALVFRVQIRQLMTRQLRRHRRPPPPAHPRPRPQLPGNWPPARAKPRHTTQTERPRTLTWVRGHSYVLRDHTVGPVVSSLKTSEWGVLRHRNGLARVDDRARRAVGTVARWLTGLGAVVRAGGGVCRLVAWLPGPGTSGGRCRVGAACLGT